MTLSSTPQLVRAVGYMSSPPLELCTCFGSLSLRTRKFSTALHRYATVPSPDTDVSTHSSTRSVSIDSSKHAESTTDNMTPAQRAAYAKAQARSKLEEQQKDQAQKRISSARLAENSLFAEQKSVSTATDKQPAFLNRSPENMSLSLNPRPTARAMWQRKMLIRHIKQKGRLSRQVQIARTERSHLSKSHFFKTSVKKLAPLARQIAGKSIDEAILQMRFSKKKAAQEVRSHLIQARDEAVVIRGMGLGRVSAGSASSNATTETDPSVKPSMPHQNPVKTLKPGHERLNTDMYVAEAWVNRGPYGAEPEFRARGRINILHPPWTGISVLLKEEKTKIRQQAEREVKAIKKRTGKNMWQQMPDRPVTRQSQHVLW